MNAVIDHFNTQQPSVGKQFKLIIESMMKQVKIVRNGNQTEATSLMK